MKIVPKTLAYLLMGILMAVLSLFPANAQEKIDLKVQKDCEAIRELYDQKSFSLILEMPQSNDRNAAFKELEKGNASPGILIQRCDLLNAKSWKSIKSDYSKTITKANKELKRIVIKYKLQKSINLTCMKNGVLKEISGIDPKCPKGFKELYRT
jgi:hypothetical protein